MVGSRGIRLLTAVAPIVIWQGTVSLGIVSSATLPPPHVIGGRTIRLFGEPEFLGHLGLTLRRTVISAGLAAGIGVPVGFAMAARERVRSVLSPVISAMFALPVVALFPLLVLVVGSTEAAIVITATVGSFVLLVWNARNGAESIDRAYVEVAADNGATSRLAVIREVWLPGSLPLVFVGLRLGLSMSLLIVTGVEFVAGNDGLGYVIWIAWQSSQQPELYATLVVIGSVGVAITEGLSRLQYRLVPWARPGDSTDVGP